MRPFPRRQNGCIHILGDFSFSDQKPHQRMHGRAGAFPASAASVLSFAAHKLAKFFGPERRPVHGLYAPGGHKKATNKPQIPTAGQRGQVPHLLEVHSEAMEPNFTLGEQRRVDWWSNHPVGAQELEKARENSCSIRKATVRTCSQRTAANLSQILSNVLFGYLRERSLLQPEPVTKGRNTAKVATNRVVRKSLLVQEGGKSIEVWPRWIVGKTRKDRRTRNKRGEHSLLLSAEVAGTGAALTGLCRIRQARACRSTTAVGAVVVINPLLCGIIGNAA
jgi:hypothetical protein